MRRANGARRHAVLAVPLALGAISLVGLVVGLLGDGLLDIASWLALGVPVAAIIWALASRRT
jgi:hypothetical protein